MKIIKYLIGFIISILIIGVVVIYFVQKGISKNLEISNKEVIDTWKIFDAKLAERDKLFSSKDFPGSDSLYYLINKSRLERKDKVNSLEIQLCEYKLNKYILSKDLRPNVETSYLYEELNKIITEYNTSVKYYNVYSSTFPNFIVAKRKGMKIAVYFNIEYGKENQDPVEKSKEVSDAGSLSRTRD